MTYSVLLPTRNRLEYLRFAVESVLRQDYPDWELIVSDNCSEDDVEAYVRSLREQRIRYYRTSRPVAVTENWNNALRKSTGDYVIMLGDDDALLPGYFSTIRRLADEYSDPDFIYAGAYLYAYPGAMPGFPRGFLKAYGYAEFLQGASEPYFLGRRQARELVEQFCNFRVAYGFNMQFSVISRKLITRLERKGPFFQSPFPDYYASNAMFLTADRILACPYPLVVIGVTPKSYGAFHFGGREAEGVEFLQSAPGGEITERLRNVLLPGTNLNTSWLFALEALCANFGTEFELQINYRRYRLLQILHTYASRYLYGQVSDEELNALRTRLTWWERLICNAAVAGVAVLEQLTKRSLRWRVVHLARAILRQTPPEAGRPLEGDFADMSAVLGHLDGRLLPAAG
jgi:glycosyltransferase involved in cell wall biosynthesis